MINCDDVVKLSGLKLLELFKDDTYIELFIWLFNKVFDWLLLTLLLSKLSEDKIEGVGSINLFSFFKSSLDLLFIKIKGLLILFGAKVWLYEFWSS